MKVKLKPCPFCSAPAIRHPVKELNCFEIRHKKHCFLDESGGTVVWFDQFKFWNRRTKETVK